MNTLEGFLFLTAITFIVSVLVFYTLKDQKLRDAKNTVLADKRSELQYDLRRSNTNANNLVLVLVGVLIAIIIVFALGKPQPNQGEELNQSQDTISYESKIKR